MKKQIKLILIADTHGGLFESDLQKTIRKNPDYNACILLGDHNYIDIRILRKLIPGDKLFGLRGNHDSDYLSTFHIKDIHGVRTEIPSNHSNFSIHITGFEGSAPYKPGTYPSFTQEASEAFSKQLPDADILFSHDGPFTPDLVARGKTGLIGISSYVQNRMPAYHIHGHWHQNYRKELENGTIEIGVYGIQVLSISQKEILAHRNLHHTPAIAASP